jgi:hypothetical protein
MQPGQWPLPQRPQTPARRHHAQRQQTPDREGHAGQLQRRHARRHPREQSKKSPEQQGADTGEGGIRHAVGPDGSGER